MHVVIFGICLGTYPHLGISFGTFPSLWKCQICCHIGDDRVELSSIIIFDLISESHDLNRQKDSSKDVHLYII